MLHPVCKQCANACSLALQVNKFDFIVFNAALFGVLFAGVDIGLGIAIGVSVVIVLWMTAFPKSAQLGRLPGTTVYRCDADTLLKTCCTQAWSDPHHEQHKPPVRSGAPCTYLLHSAAC